MSLTRAWKSFFKLPTSFLRYKSNLEISKKNPQMVKRSSPGVYQAILDPKIFNEHRVIDQNSKWFTPHLVLICIIWDLHGTHSRRPNRKSVLSQVMDIKFPGDSKPPPETNFFVHAHQSKPSKWSKEELIRAVQFKIAL